MANKIVLKLDRLPDEVLVQNARSLAARLLENAADFPNAEPSPATIQAAAEALESGLSEAGNMQQAATAATEAKNTLRAILEGLLTDSAGWAEHKVKDPARLMKVYSLKKPPTRTTWVPQVQRVAVKFGDRPGALDLTWDAEATAASYEIRCRYLVDGNGHAPFVHATTVTRSFVTLEALNSAQMIQLQVRAIGPNGLVGPWSDSIDHLVP